MAEVKSCWLVVCILLAVAAIAGAGETLQVFGHDWAVLNGGDWKIVQDEGQPVLSLLTPRGPIPDQPRRPRQFAIAQTPDFTKVTSDAELMPRRRSLIIVYNYRDPAHFDYAHLSSDTGLKQPVHNGIFHVFGGERVRISSQDGPAAFGEKDRWDRIHLVQDGETGAIQVEVDGKKIPALHAVDLSLKSGKVGLGSFDEIGDFRNVRISGAAVRPGAN